MKSQPLVTEAMRKLLIVLALLGGALFVRWIAILQTPVIANDAILYIKLAKLYAAGDYAVAFERYPYFLLPLLIAFSQKIWGDWVLAGQWVSTLCGALTVIPLYLLARRIFDEKIALWCALFYIICPSFVRFSAEILRDMPLILFFMLALWWGFEGIKDKKSIFIALASVFLYLAALFRAEGLPLLIVFPLYFIWLGLKERLALKRVVVAIVILFFFFPALVSPMGVFLSQKVDRLNLDQLNAVKYHFTMSVGDITMKGVEEELENKNLSIYARNLFQLAREQRFILYLFHIAYKLIEVFTVPLFILFLFGLFKRKRTAYRSDEFIMVVMYGVFITAFLLYLNNTNYFSDRHTFPIAVPSLIWSGVGFVELKERIIQWIRTRNSPLRDRAMRYLTPLLLVIICVPLLATAWAPHRKDKLELKEIGLWLRDHGYAHSIIIGQDDFPRLAFYADGELIKLPKGSYQDIIRFAREKKANLLVINPKTIDHLSPDFFEKISPRDLQRIDIPGIKTTKYATTVFLIRGKKERK